MIRNSVIKLFLFFSFITYAPFSFSQTQSEKAFQQRRQEWLNRDGQKPWGGYDQNPHTGRSFLFAWLEQGKYLNSGPDIVFEPMRGFMKLSPLPDQIRELMQGYMTFLQSGTPQFMYLWMP